MIYLILKSYLTILLSIAFGAIAVFSFGVYFILKKTKPSQKRVVPTVEKEEVIETLQSIEAIAGDDVLATQLDLARAYLETGRKQLAKNILESVVMQGSSHHQQEAQQLLSSL